MKKNWRCKWFGHKLHSPIYINKVGEYKFIATYCTRCWLGNEELHNFVSKNSPIINTFNERYFYQ